MKYKKPISRCRSWILKIYYESVFANAGNLNPIQDGFFRGCSRMGGGGGLFAPPLKSATHILQ